MKSRNVFVYEKDARSPLENLAINKYFVDLVENKEFDMITRVYKHKKGVILGNMESVGDVDLDYARQNNYEIVRRPSGGSAIVTDPNSTLCYSVFFNSGMFDGIKDINNAYESVVIPIAKKLGDKFSVEGVYYLRYDLGDKRIPVAGHALRSTKGAMQFDGVVNMEKLDAEEVSKVLKLRELYEFNGDKYLSVGGHFYDLKGSEIIEVPEGLRKIRSEKSELESLVGLKDLGISEEEFVGVLRDSMVEGFGDFFGGDLNKDSEKVGKYMNEINSRLNYGKKKFLGHCFIDFVEEEPRIHYGK